MSKYDDFINLIKKTPDYKNRKTCNLEISILTPNPHSEGFIEGDTLYDLSLKMSEKSVDRFEFNEGLDLVRELGFSDYDEEFIFTYINDVEKDGEPGKVFKDVCKKYNLKFEDFIDAWHKGKPIKIDLFKHPEAIELIYNSFY